MQRVNGKVTLVTGAGAGIGEAIAKLFAHEGAVVILTDIHVEKGERVAQEIQRAGGSAFFMALDVRNECHWSEVIDKILLSHRRLDVLVNNAGIALRKSVVETSYQAWRHLMNVNLDSVFLGTKCAIKAMEQQGGGSIVNVSSTAGIVGHALASAYCASKGGVTLFTKAVALECAQLRNHIRVNAVHPGPVYTEIWESTEGWENYLKEVGSKEAAWEVMAQSSPLARVARPEEIASAILYLASDEAAYVTGSSLVIDGGITA